MNPKRQKKYTSEQMIIKDIDRALRQRDRLIQRAESLDATAEIEIGMNDSSRAEEIVKLREESKRVRKKATRIEETRLKKLKNTLASFRTRELPGIDASNVVLLSK